VAADLLAQSRHLAADLLKVGVSRSRHQRSRDGQG
jgi:hypothetical protein